MKKIIVNFCLINFIFLLSFNLLGQHEIRYITKNKCDTLNSAHKFIKVKIGIPECDAKPDLNQIIYFTKKESLIFEEAVFYETSLTLEE